MEETCPGCVSVLPDAAERCPRCGLVFDATPPEAAGSAIGQALEIYGFAPEQLPIRSGSPAPADAPGPESQAEAAADPPPRPRSTSRRGCLAVGVAVLLSVAVLVWAAARPRPFPDEEVFRDLLARGRISAPVGPYLGDDERLAEIENRYQGSVETARKLRTAVERGSPHEVFDAYVARLAEFDPAAAADLGHAHPEALHAVDELSRLRHAYLARDLISALEDSDPGDAHEAVDRDLLLDHARLVLHTLPGDERRTFETLSDWLWSVAELPARRCCDPDELAAVTAARMRALAAELPRLAGSGSPPASWADLARRQVRDLLEHLDSPAWNWSHASPAARRAIRGAEPGLRRALAEALEALARRRAFAGRPTATGKETLGVVLRHGLHLDEPLADHFRRAVDAFVEARHARLRIERTRWASPALVPPSGGLLTDRLRDAAPHLVGPIPADPGVELAPLPPMFARAIDGWYLPSGGEVPARVLIGADPDVGSTVGEGAAERMHLLAHESYPGHHVEGLFARSRCALRRALAGDAFWEGWASYSLVALHDAGGCLGGAEDEWDLWRDREWTAWTACLTLAVECGALFEDQALELMRETYEHRIGYSDLAEMLHSPGRAASYQLGFDAILRARRAEEQRLGERFDLVDFHRRLLVEGVLPRSGALPSR